MHILSWQGFAAKDAHAWPNDAKLRRAIDGTLHGMQDEVRRAFIAERDAIRTRWEALLRERGAKTPLGNPDSLVFMMDWTMDEIFSHLRTQAARRPAGHCTNTADCACGMNPLLEYFNTAEIALTEALNQVYEMQPHNRALDQGAGMKLLRSFLVKIRRREIETFCAVCQRRPECRNKAVCYARGEAPCIRSR